MAEVCDKCGAPMAVSRAGKLYCSAKCWLPENQQNTQKQQVPKPVVKAAVNEGIGEVIHLFPNKYETGPAGNRHEIRYWKVEELENQLNALRNMGELVDKY